jgi:outer membrane lipoprotein SlyB
LMTSAAIAAMFVLPQIANAQTATEGAATGAVVGGVTGAVVGGPVGAAVGAGVGATVGAGAGDTNRRQPDGTVIIEQRSPTVRERNCVTNAAGTTVCEEVRR